LADARAGQKRSKCRKMPDSSDGLPHVLNQLLLEFASDANVLSIVVVGSAARQQLNGYSDLDIHVVVQSERPPDRSYYHNGRLVNINFMDKNNREQMFVSPWTAIWNIAATRSAQIFYDRDHFYNDLQTRARAFAWATVAEAARPEIARLLVGASEEVHKILAGLRFGLAEKMLYASNGLTLSLANAAALADGVLIESENHFYSSIAAANTESWGVALWQALGFAGESITARAEAALKLYCLSIKRYSEHLTPAQRQISDQTLGLIGENNMKASQDQSFS
jgi:hypothetical protein